MPTTNQAVSDYVSRAQYHAQEFARSFQSQFASAAARDWTNRLLCNDSHGWGSVPQMIGEYLSSGDLESAMGLLAESAAFEAFTLIPTDTERDGYTLHPMRMRMCAEHAAAFRATLASATDESCAACAAPIASDELSSTLTGRRYWNDATHTTTGEPAPRAVVSRARAVRFSDGTEHALPNPGTYVSGHRVCVPCRYRRTCEHCATWSPLADDINAPTSEWASCNACGVNYHTACEDHSDHVSRRDFQPRSDLYNAFNVMPESGNTIRSTRYIGCEIETGADPSSADYQIAWRPIFDVDANAPTPLISNIGTDGSVGLDDGAEIRSLPIGGAHAEHFLAEMRRALPTANAGWDCSTGGHVHIDARDAIARGTQQTLWAALAAADIVWMGATDSERWAESGEYGNEYARPVDETHITNGFAGRRVYLPSRYMTVNNESLDSHSTVEIRAFGADCYFTAEFVHAVAFATALADYTVRYPSEFTDHEGRFTVEEIDALCEALTTRGAITRETAQHVHQFAVSGTYTLDMARSNAYGDDDEYYCEGGCGNYFTVDGYTSGCAHCYRCDNCGCDC
jgi:hypothetical protein